MFDMENNMDIRSSIRSRDLIKEDIPDALEVSREELGSDYLTENDFLGIINSDSAFCKAAIYKGRLAGFEMCRIFGPEQADGMLHLPDSPDKDHFLSKKKIGLFDSVAVRRDLQGLGIGTELESSCLREFTSRDVDIICAMAWKSVDGTINAKKVLERMGLTPHIEVPNYWNQMVDSPGGHDCPVCGRPCKCSAVLYYKDMK
ncbi:hypothetical protein Mpt1_c10270 [Candidatus Methanoplasma termitum]|uniref:N-acetyltransferase domain-containing protein n=1 Tax=Candidatus Methanoplasma termitum TaxID=1577791 RepID=A0A0A7LD14_9ARCH|nr:GNAT family N-acetyltransferase [Candidatus Methanoplasma termitum]AIZ56898.1 hypothetical protein Mpt1_c10270 [Candidatus Methanoplasma termitum]